MGRYISWDSVTAKYPTLAKVTAGGQPLFEQIYIAPTESELDARMASKYLVPFCTTPTLAPPVIVGLALDMCYFNAAGIRAKDGKQINDSIQERIKSILAGTMLIQDVNGTLLPVLTQGAWSSTAGFGSSFGMDDPSNWNVNSDWQQASQDARG